jgi:O-antigen/teichoic acid export membrane protein
MAATVPSSEAENVNSLGRRIVVFAIPVAVPAASGLLVTSLVAHRAGASSFLALALGQSVGTFGALMAGWGWDLVGPPRVAAATYVEQRLLLAQSIANRVVACVVVFPIALLIAWLLAPEGQGALGALSAAAAVVAALSPGWWLIGQGRARELIHVDTVPRTVAAMVSAALVALGFSAAAYPTLTFLAAVSSYGVFYVRLHPLRADRRLLRPTMTFPKASTGMLIMLISGLYSSSALPLVQVVAPGAAASFASAYRLLTYWNFSTIVTGNALQNWVVQVPSEYVSRLRRALALLSAQGVVLGLALALLGQLTSELLFGSALSSPRLTYVWFAVAFACISVGTWCGRLVLLPARREGPLLVANVVAAGVGVLGIILLGPARGANGAAFGLMVAELSMLAVAGFAASHVSKRMRVTTRAASRFP